MTELPDKRVTDKQRHHAAELLSDALSRGQLTITEFDERSALAFQAVRRADLVTLFDDLLDNPEQNLFGSLPVANRGQIPSRYEQAYPAQVSDRVVQAVARVKGQVTGEPGTSRWSIAIMGGATRRHWVVPRNHISIAVMGGNAIDLRDARFEGKDITINALCIMGGVDIVVPEGMRVIDRGFALMGGFDSKLHKSAEVSPASLPADAPTLTVTGFALMGGVAITTKPA